MPLPVSEINIVREKYIALNDCLTEKGRRLWGASEAMSYGRGGIALICRATGLSNATIHKGIKEIECPDASSQGRIRQAGGGRKKTTKTQRGLKTTLDKLVDPTAKGDPMSPLRWTSKSTRNLNRELSAQGYKISQSTIVLLLGELGYSLQANRKSLEGASHEDRDAQFVYINKSLADAQQRSQPTISVDTKKKELVGNYKNNGQEYRRKGDPLKTKGHDFPDKILGKVVPYGVYDIGKNRGWVSIGISSDTAQFAVNSIRTWWHTMGRPIYPAASEVVLTADCGGSNGYRVKLWKWELQKLADETNLSFCIRHFPPGTSKWNKIEHRLFSYISENWRGKPLLTREIVVSLIASTRTSKGLEVQAVLDLNNYDSGLEITKEQMKTLNIIGDKFHPEWNYTIRPRNENKNMPQDTF